MILRVSSQVGVNIVAKHNWVNSANQVLYSASPSLWVAITFEEMQYEADTLPRRTSVFVNRASFGH